MKRFARAALMSVAALGIAGASGVAIAQDAETDPEAEVEAPTAPPSFVEVQGTWAVADEACETAPWQIVDGEFTTGAIGALCSFDPTLMTESINRSRTVTTLYTAASCDFSGEASLWNYYFMLSETGQTLWVSASNGLDRTLRRCEAGSDVGP